MIVEVALTAAAVAIVVDHFRMKAVKERDQRILITHGIIADLAINFGEKDETDLWYPHRWSKPTRDVIYTSKLPWSYDQVIANVTHCEKCRMVHRHITKGMKLATYKGLQIEDGFYHSGVKTANPGCPFPDRIMTSNISAFNSTVIDCHEERACTPEESVVE